MFMRSSIYRKIKCFTLLGKCYSTHFINTWLHYQLTTCGVRGATYFKRRQLTRMGVVFFFYSRGINKVLVEVPSNSLSVTAVLNQAIHRKFILTF